MSKRPFRVQQIDHVELFVPDRYEAAKWYEQVFGLEILREYQFWAVPGGPLMISSDNGRTKLALFEGQPRGSRKSAGHHLVAFRVDGPGFLDFIARLADIAVFNDGGERIAPRHVVDHEKSYSIYLCDPYGHRYEVTTYDYDHVSRALANL